MDMVDDASGHCEARMGKEETIWAAAGVLRAWIENHGVPRALYTDWKNVYKRKATPAEQLRGKVSGSTLRNVRTYFIGPSLIAPQRLGPLLACTWPQVRKSGSSGGRKAFSQGGPVLLLLQGRVSHCVSFLNPSCYAILCWNEIPRRLTFSATATLFFFILMILSVAAVGQTDPYPHNSETCERCHNSPAQFGSSAMTVQRIGSIYAGRFIPSSEGGIHTGMEKQHRVPPLRTI